MWCIVCDKSTNFKLVQANAYAKITKNISVSLRMSAIFANR